jgi:hypothetical protein
MHWFLKHVKKKNSTLIFLINFYDHYVAIVGIRKIEKKAQPSSIA